MKKNMERIMMSEEDIKRACELSMKAHKYGIGSKQQYLYEESSSSSEAVFVFAGALKPISYSRFRTQLHHTVLAGISKLLTHESV